MIPEQQQRQKAVIEFNSGNPSFDVIALSYHVQKRPVRARTTGSTDLRPMIADKSLTDPNLDFADFAQGRHELRRRSPTDASTACRSTSIRGCVYYNKELFDAKGVAYPEDLRGDDRRGGEAQRSRQGRLRASSARGSRTPTFRCGRASCWATAAASSMPSGKLMTDTRRSDRVGEDVPDAARQIRPAGRRRLQLERIAEPVPAGQGGDVARRHRLRAAARGSRPNRASSARSATA